MKVSPSVKRYPHFDPPLSLDAAQLLATSPSSVANHAFYPFLEYEKRWTRYAKKGKAGKTKCRLIRYAARRDSFIHAHYRSIISNLYEAKLAAYGLSEAVIGYRRVAVGSKAGNKCNINFASDAFKRIRGMGDCHVYALDISKFFEHLDHSILKKRWAALLGAKNLPEDHYRVFKSVTAYSCVNKIKAYEALGLIGHPMAPSTGPKQYLKKYQDIPVQLCDSAKFRALIVPLAQKNDSGCGIPQGAAISDVLSNLYLFDFDVEMNAWATKHGGFYLRYSDDILIATDGLADRWSECFNMVESLIKASGNKLEIQPAKCSAYRLEQTSSSSSSQKCSLVHQTGCNNGIEYLGFRYDGRNVYLWESTRSKLNRSIVKACRRTARSHVHFNPTAPLNVLESTVKAKRVFEQIGRVKDFESKANSYKKWTFWTYIKRCHAVLGKDGRPIFKQSAGYRRFVNRKLKAELILAYSNKP